MTRDEFEDAMERVGALMTPPRNAQEQERIRKWKGELFEAMKYMHVAIFRDIITEVIRNHKTQGWPTIHEFLTARKTITKSKNVPDPEKCRICNGNYWVDVFLLDIDTMRPDSAARPCRNCNPYQPQSTTGYVDKRRLKEITHEEYKEHLRKWVEAKNAEANAHVGNLRSALAGATGFPAASKNLSAIDEKEKGDRMERERIAIESAKAWARAHGIDKNPAYGTTTKTEEKASARKPW